LIALALTGIDHGPSRAAARTTAQSVTVTPSASVPMLTGTLVPVNNSQGDQTNPHVDRDRVSYTNDDFAGHSVIHLFDFSTATDSVIPGNGLDRLSNIGDTHVAFSELTSLGDHIVLFDTTTQTSTVVSGVKCTNPALGGNLVAFEDRSDTSSRQSEIDVYDISTSTVTQLTNDALFDKNPSLSPNGSAIAWEKCVIDGAGCDIYSAIQTSPGIFATQALTGSTGEDRTPDTNGEIVVYTSNRGGDTDIYYQPIGGGTETQIAIPGDQRDVRISGNLIVFESQTVGPLFSHDVFVYDISSGSFYQVTNTPIDDERLSDISVWNGTGRIVYAVAGGFGDFDVYAFTFQVPSSVQSDINGLIALVNNFNLPHGIENSLVTKLQDALTALNASDTATACDSLSAFVNQCSAQSGKTLTEQQANQLINSATQIRTGLGCQ
jgi:Tol biopolymer transport system component